MTLFELLNNFTPCNKINFNIVSPYIPEVKDKLKTTTIYSHQLLDDICESTLNKIEVEFMSLYADLKTGTPYIKVFISAKTESALIPLITRLNYEYERVHR